MALDLNKAQKYLVRFQYTLQSIRWTLTTVEPQSASQQPGIVLSSAALPHYATYVKTIKIGGMAIPR